MYGFQAGSMNPTGMLSCFPFYHSPMKLWEGDVFTGVCHSVWRGEVYHMHLGIGRSPNEPA